MAEPQHTSVADAGSVAGLPPRFETAMLDDALAPDTPRGTGFLFSTSAVPSDGDVVIVETPAGRRYMRLFFALDGEDWEARTRDPARSPLHSARDGIKLLATATHRACGQG